MSGTNYSTKLKVSISAISSVLNGFNLGRYMWKNNMEYP